MMNIWPIHVYSSANNYGFIQLPAEITASVLPANFSPGDTFASLEDLVTQHALALAGTMTKKRSAWSRPEASLKTKEWRVNRGTEGTRRALSHLISFNS